MNRDFKTILNLFSQIKNSNKFYFTGATALSLIYLNHRISLFEAFQELFIKRDFIARGIQFYRDKSLEILDILNKDRKKIL